MVILIKNLKKRLGNFELLIDNLKIDKSFFGFFGPSGSGKTTLLRIIAGLEIPDSGEILFNKKIFYSSSKNINIPPSERKIGFVFQEIPLLSSLKVFECIKLVCKNEEKIKKIAKKIEVFNLLNKKVFELSRGQKQKVEICIALLSDPKILLLDEPFASIDIKTRIKLIKIIKEFVKKRKIISIIATHDVFVAKKLCEKIALIENGKIKETVSIRDFDTLFSFYFK